MDPKPSPAYSPPLVSRMLFRVFRAMGCGAVLLGPDKRVLHLNERARTCLGNGLVMRGGCLYASDKVSDAALQATLDRHLSTSSTPLKRGQRDALGVRREEHRPLIVRVVPVDVEARASLGSAALLLIIVDPEDCPEPSDGMLQQVFGLTKSEAKVANRMMCGDALAHIAKAHAVEINTIRSQVKSIFAKTQTSRQSELVALMTRLAVIAEE